MPTISTFLGISIRMYFGDHNPPHFHAYYGSESAKFSIDTLEAIGGGLPRRVRQLVVEFAFEHRLELRANWERGMAGNPLLPIAPLE